MVVELDDKLLTQRLDFSVAVAKAGLATASAGGIILSIAAVDFTTGMVQLDATG